MSEGGGNRTRKSRGDLQASLIPRDEIFDHELIAAEHPAVFTAASRAAEVAHHILRFEFRAADRAKHPDLSHIQMKIRLPAHRMLHSDDPEGLFHEGRDCFCFAYDKAHFADFPDPHLCGPGLHCIQCIIDQ